MKYILLQTIISSFKDLAIGLSKAAAYVAIILVGFLALFLTVGILMYLIPVLIPICLILTFTKPVKDLLGKINPKVVQIYFGLLTVFQSIIIFMLYKYSYLSETLRADKEQAKSLFLNALSYVLNIDQENINMFLFYENLSVIMMLALLLLFVMMFLFYPGIKGFISHHKKIAQEKYDSLSNHEKLTKF